MPDSTLAYSDFIARKRVTHIDSGFDPPELLINTKLFDWQKDVLLWACRKGRSSLFLDTGLGKSGIQLAWADAVHRQTGKDVLVLAPLAVGQQTLRESIKFEIQSPVTVCRESHQVKSGITISNYERLHKLPVEKFGGVVLDECFSPDTLVDVVDIRNNVHAVHICDVLPGDRIINASGVDRVKASCKRRVSSAVLLKVRGREITCSENHPFFTLQGWKPAKDLRSQDCLVETASAVCLLRSDLQSEISCGTLGKVLRNEMLQQMENDHSSDNGQSSLRGNVQEVGSRIVEMDAKRSPKGHCPERAFSEMQRRERTATNARAGVYEECAVECLESRAYDPNRSEVLSRESQGDDYVLQSRFGGCEAENRHRNRWPEPSQEIGTGSGSRRDVEFARVESVEILEQTDSRLARYRDEDGSLYFYDIEAERHPSFSVHGLLVHNSSILKSLNGTTRQFIQDTFSQTPYKLCCTATPAPNDQMELGSHAEFCGAMLRTEMLSMFFVHDGGETSKWRLRGHARKKFYEWMASWAVAIRKPGDVGYSNEGYDLPALRFHEHIVDTPKQKDQLFATEAKTLGDQRAARRNTIDSRVDILGEQINNARSQCENTWLIWCNLNDESESAAKAFKQFGAVEVTGSDDIDKKEETLNAFSQGQIPILVSKSEICGFGSNWQHCHQQGFLGVSHSWEQFYQAIRRSYRFGQTREVDVHITTSEAEIGVLANLKRKQAESDSMNAAMVASMGDITRNELKKIAVMDRSYNADNMMKLQPWLKSGW